LPHDAPPQISSTRTAQVDGDVDPRFAELRDLFEQSFARGLEVGAAVAVTLDGEPVVDLWGGFADQARTRPWERDTLVNLYSSTKGVTALCAHRLIERGDLDLDAPVAAYWPEFAQAGKTTITVRWVLSHRAGLPAIRRQLPPEALYQSEAMTTAIAEERPWWVPGRQHGYHALTFGWLLGELVRRVTGKSVGRYFSDEVAAPLGLDLHIGLADAHHARVAEMSAMARPVAGDAGQQRFAAQFAVAPDGITALAYMNPPSMAFGPNLPEWRRAEIPAANGHGTARALARMYGALAIGGRLDDVHLLNGSSIRRCLEEQSRGHDPVLLVTSRFSLGFMLSQPDVPNGSFGPNRDTFGHPGAGGSVGFADLNARVGFAYVMNKMGPHLLLDPRPVALIDALYRALS
jgi:CubicO group peptidase (beta-lactamase class C family)